MIHFIGKNRSRSLVRDYGTYTSKIFIQIADLQMTSYHLLIQKTHHIKTKIELQFEFIKILNVKIHIKMRRLSLKKIT